MIPSFTGSARPRRQVNLSGRNNNPFTTHSVSRQPQSSQSAHNALANAQQERIQRQHERERPPAAVKIQRVWRGHRDRARVRSRWRQLWDDEEAADLGFQSTNHRSAVFSPQIQQIPPYKSPEACLRQLRLLVHFVSFRNEDDIYRLQHFTTRFIQPGSQRHIDPSVASWTTALSLLARLITKVLLELRTVDKPLQYDNLVFLLSTVATRIPEKISPPTYYRALASLVQLNFRSPCNHDVIETAIQSLLSNEKLRPEATARVYDGFAWELLTVPELLSAVDLRFIAVDYHMLTAAVLRHLPTQLNTKNDLLWLLAHYIYFGRREPDQQPSGDYVKVISAMVSALAGTIEARMTAESNIFEEEEDLGLARPNSLPSFIEEQISSLVNQRSISGLLARFETISTSFDDDSEGSKQTSALATYALTLFRVFPRRGDEIRMWLFLGSAARGSGHKIPAVKFFFEASRSTQIYQSIKRDPRAAIELLRSNHDIKVNKISIRAEARDRQWRVIMIFMELYVFVLKIMDDEEFLSGSTSLDSSQSWSRQSALLVEQIADLTLFLKHLAYTLYRHTSEIVRIEEVEHKDSIAEYFSVKSGQKRSDLEKPQALRPEEASIAGMPGMTLAYFKGTVTGLLRMIYERDSRRKFLPTGHWLMTDYFAMDQFVKAVVEEEKEKQKIEGSYDAAPEESSEQFDEEDRVDVDNLVGSRRTQRLREIQRLKEQQSQRSRQRYLASVTPRLEILQNMPFFIPFATRVQIFRKLVEMDQSKRRGGFLDPDDWRLNQFQHRDVDMTKHRATVRRENVFDDAYKQFFGLSDGLKEPIQIKFVDQFGTEEEGIDGGGVTKEFLTSVTSEAFSATESLDLFIENDQHLLFPNPAAVEARRDLLKSAGLKESDPEWTGAIRDLLRRYEFLGRIVGKCLYESILVDVHFAPFFLLKWALTGGINSAARESSYRANLNDLRDLDEGLYQGLLQLKNYTGNVEDFSLTFEIDDVISQRSTDSSTPSTRIVTRELRPGGSSIPVTNENRLVYISYVARHRLQIQPHRQTSAFLDGLGTIVSPSWLSMFNQTELQTLLSGSRSEISIDDLRKHTMYGGVYTVGDDGLEHPTVRLFWEVLQKFEDADRRKLLKFVTSTPRAPLLGFEMLNPWFSIRDSGNDQSRLPTTSTCVNLLKLPIYRTKEVLRERLLYSVNAGAGFNLS